MFSVRIGAERGKVFLGKISLARLDFLLTFSFYPGPLPSEAGNSNPEDHQDFNLFDLELGLFRAHAILVYSIKG